MQARAGAPFYGVLDAFGPPCLTANVGLLLSDEFDDIRDCISQSGLDAGIVRVQYFGPRPFLADRVSYESPPLHLPNRKRNVENAGAR